MAAPISIPTRPRLQKKLAKNEDRYFALLDFDFELRSWVITSDPPSTCSNLFTFAGFRRPIASSVNGELSVARDRKLLVGLRTVAPLLIK